MPPHGDFEIVENHVEAGVAANVDVDLVAGVPVRLKGPGKDLRLHDPLARVSIEIGLANLYCTRISGHKVGVKRLA
jgi:hypothetical protein